MPRRPAQRSQTGPRGSYMGGHQMIRWPKRGGESARAQLRASGPQSRPQQQSQSLGSLGDT
eukprot:13920756-Alexandrium_andersonii.AAC.1